MIIEFEDKKLKGKLTTLGKAKKEFGQRIAEVIFRRIKQLETAQDEKELYHIPGNFHPLTSNRLGQWACRLDANWRLIFRLRGEEEYIAVIVEVVDYH